MTLIKALRAYLLTLTSITSITNLIYGIKEGWTTYTLPFIVMNNISEDAQVSYNIRNLVMQISLIAKSSHLTQLENLENTIKEELEYNFRGIYTYSNIDLLEFKFLNSGRTLKDNDSDFYHIPLTVEIIYRIND